MQNPTDILFPDGKKDPRARLAQLAQQYANAPAFWTGNGETGLSRNDAVGYSRFLNDQTEYKNLQRQLQGKGPLDVEIGESFGSPAYDTPDSYYATEEDSREAMKYPSARVTGSTLVGLRKAAQRG